MVHGKLNIRAGRTICKSKLRSRRAIDVETRAGPNRWQSNHVRGRIYAREGLIRHVVLSGAPSPGSPGGELVGGIGRWQTRLDLRTGTEWRRIQCATRARLAAVLTPTEFGHLAA